MNANKNAKNPGKVGVGIVSLLLVVLLVLNIGTSMYSNVITQFFSSPETDKAAISEITPVALDVVERLEAEGMVLLENKNNTLPLDTASEMNINVFGWSSIDPTYTGGVGSATGNLKNTVSFLEALANQGFTVNQDLISFYEGLGYSRGILNSWGSFDIEHGMLEVPMGEYSQGLLDQARAFSDAAVIMFTRVGNESAGSMSDYEDDSKHDLELSDEEMALIDTVTSMGFSKVVLLINSTDPIELGYIEDKGIGAVLWIGGPGQTGMNSVARALKGDVNPSGRLVDTYAYDLTSAPSYSNLNDFAYSDGAYTAIEGFSGMESEFYYGYTDYTEDIYVGYRYYETRYIDNETGECDDAAYQEAVQYPFGYGKSYTTFKQEISSFTSNNKTASMTVRVTNTGNMAGKEVVQVYVTAPYTVGGIEKSHVSLIGFAKTGLLELGASEEVEISFAIEDIASFDYQDKGCYVLDAGTYEIKLMANAHDLIDSETIELNDTIVYSENNKRDSDDISAVTRFADAEGEVTYLSRADWEGTWPQDVPAGREAGEELLETLGAYAPAREAIDTAAEDIVIQDHGIMLEEMIGFDYDDPKWESMLEQLTVEEMQSLIGLGGYATQAIKHIGKPYSVELDGPAGIQALVNAHAYDGVAYPSAVSIASTWNTELVREMGETYGAEAKAWGISGIYGPTINIHRSPFGSRNFEYYSEDGFLSGKMAAGIAAGFNESGVYCFIKHFALYDTPGSTMGTATWINEQALREIYLKPFELAAKEGNARAVMSSYSRVGATWTGGSYALLTEVLRNEWGFRGMVISDWFYPSSMDATQGVYAGNDLMLATVNGGDMLSATHDKYRPTDTSIAGKHAMRKASYNILYTVANSVAMEHNNYGPTPYWLYALIAVDVLAVAGAVWFFIRRRKKMKASIPAI